nr:protein CREG2 isoform X2 [Kogia breviceps]
MSGRRGRQPGPRLSWLLCCSALLSPAAGYVIVSSVSWAVTNEVDEELDSASTEEALPALLEDSGSIWQRSFPASAHEEDPHLPPPEGTARARPPPAPPGMFSYRREGSARLRPGTARFLAHASAWGCLATVSAHEKIPGLPFGNCLPVSDGPFDNSTGVPFFYVTPKDLLVADLMKNPMASLLLPESEEEFCRVHYCAGPASAQAGSVCVKLTFQVQHHPVGFASRISVTLSTET